MATCTQYVPSSSSSSLFFWFLVVVEMDCLLMSVSGRAACAYFDPVKARIYVMEDTQETGHYDLIRMGVSLSLLYTYMDMRILTEQKKIVLEQCTPDICLTSTKSDDAFVDILRAHSTYRTLFLLLLLSQLVLMGGYFL